MLSPSWSPNLVQVQGSVPHSQTCPSWSGEARGLQEDTAAKCLVFEEEFGFTPLFKDRVVQEQPVAVWTRTERSFPSLRALLIHYCFLSFQYIVTAWTYHLKKVPKMSLLSLKKQLSNYKILPGDGGGRVGFLRRTLLGFHNVASSSAVLEQLPSCLKSYWKSFCLKWSFRAEEVPLW